MVNSLIKMVELAMRIVKFAIAKRTMLYLSYCSPKINFSIQNSNLYYSLFFEYLMELLSKLMIEFGSKNSLYENRQ